MTAHRPLPSEAEITRALSAAIKQGQRITRYRVTRDGVEVICTPEDDSTDLDLIDWKK